MQSVCFLLSILTVEKLRFAAGYAVSAVSAVSSVCAHQFNARFELTGAAHTASGLLRWDPIPLLDRSGCREIELRVYSEGPGPGDHQRLNGPSGLAYLACDASRYHLRDLAWSGRYRVDFSVLEEPAGTYCRELQTLVFVMNNSNSLLVASSAANSNSTGLLSIPRWTITDALIFLLVLTGWAAAIALFLHKLGNLQISRSTCDSVRHLKPKNIDKVKVCKEPSDTVIYREYARGSRMSVCLEERQARIAHLQRLYAEELERELEAIEEQAGSAELCGLRPLRPRSPKPFHRHHTLDAISPQRLPTYAVVAEGGINLQQLPQLPAQQKKTPLGQTFSASAVDAVPRSQQASAVAQVTFGPSARRVGAVKNVQLQQTRRSVRVSSDGATKPLLTRQLSESAFSKVGPSGMTGSGRSGSDAVISYV